MSVGTQPTRSNSFSLHLPAPSSGSAGFEKFPENFRELSCFFRTSRDNWASGPGRRGSRAKPSRKEKV